MSRFRQFVNSIGENVDRSIYELSDEQLLKLLAFYMGGAAIKTQSPTMYKIAVLLYLLLENNGFDSSMFVDTEEVRWMDMLAMMGDILVAYNSGVLAGDGVPYWADHASNLLAIVLGHEDYELAEFRYSPYQATSITTP